MVVKVGHRFMILSPHSKILFPIQQTRTPKQYTGAAVRLRKLEEQAEAWIQTTDGGQ